MLFRRSKNNLGVPHKVNAIAGDGNCFFRTISYELCGTAEHHLHVRAAVVQFMSADANAQMFSDYISKTVTTYLCDTQMANDGTWATDVEIVATATLLQTTIYVFSDVNCQRRWYKYKALLSKEDGCYNQNIYITNVNQHFERVVDVQ